MSNDLNEFKVTLSNIGEVTVRKSGGYWRTHHDKKIELPKFFELEQMGNSRPKLKYSHNGFTEMADLSADKYIPIKTLLTGESPSRELKRIEHHLNLLNNSHEALDQLELDLISRVRARQVKENERTDRENKEIKSIQDSFEIAYTESLSEQDQKSRFFKNLHSLLDLNERGEESLDKIIEMLPSSISQYSDFCDEYDITEWAGDAPHTTFTLKSICLTLASDNANN